MSLMTLLPMLGLNIPAPLLSVGMKLMQTPGVFKDGAFNQDLALEQLPSIIKDDMTVTKALVNIGLRGIGISPAAATLAANYAFDSNGERTEAEAEAFTAQFRYLNSPQGRIELPFGCKVCNRIHYDSSEVNIGASGNPVCARCSREIPLN